MQARLILLDPPGAQRELKLSLPATIGRSREAKIKLVHNQVSRVHCEFFEQDGLLHVRDLGSTNGTYVGDERVTESAIQPGQTVTIGAVKLQALYEPAAGATAAAPVSRGTDTIRRAAEATLQPQPPETPKGPAGADEPPPAEKAAGWPTEAGDTDHSLNILPPQSDAAAAADPDADLKWRVPEPSSPTGSDFAFDLEEPHEAPGEQRQSSRPPEQPPTTDDKDLERFLKNLGEEKPE